MIDSFKKAVRKIFGLLTPAEREARQKLARSCLAVTCSGSKLIQDSVYGWQLSTPDTTYFLGTPALTRQPSLTYDAIVKLPRIVTEGHRSKEDALLEFGIYLHTAQEKGQNLVVIRGQTMGVFEIRADGHVYQTHRIVPDPGSEDRRLTDPRASFHFQNLDPLAPADVRYNSAQALIEGLDPLNTGPK